MAKSEKKLSGMAHEWVDKGTKNIQNIGSEK
jgi:hypothetical protein